MSFQRFPFFPDERTVLIYVFSSLRKYPISVLAKSRNAWWPGEITGHELPTNGKKVPVKYLVRWTDGTEKKIVRKDFLTPQEPDFYKVKVRFHLIASSLDVKLTRFRYLQMGETIWSVPKNYSKTLTAFVENNVHTLQSILDNTYAYTRDWNEDFFAGGNKREGLAQKARFGEFNEDHKDTLGEALISWLLPKVLHFHSRITFPFHLG